MKNHKWAILLAVLAGIIIASPQAYFRYDNQDQNTYQGVEVQTYSPGIPWIQEIREGHIFVSSPYFKDGKDDPYLFQPLGTIIVTFLGKVFSLGLNDTILFSRFLFSFLVFLLIYGFVLLLSREKIIALTSPTIILLGITLLSRQGLLQILSGESPRIFLSFFRPVIPALTFFFFFGFLLCFWLFLEKRQLRYGVLSAVILGLTFYDYFYTWTFLYAFGGVLILIYSFLKKWQDIKKIATVLFGGAIIAIPYFVNLYQASLHPNYQELSQRFGVIETHTPTLGFLIPILLVIFLVFFPRKWKERYYFVLALVVAPFIVLNQQLITGKILQNAHYHWRYHTPLAIIFLLIIFFSWISTQKLQFYKKALAISLITISVYTGIFIQSASYADKEDEVLQRQRYGLVTEWLNANAEDEEVVFANEETSYFTVIYTNLNVFHGSMAFYSLAASQERLLNNLFVFYRLDGVGEDEAREVFARDKGKISSTIYGIYYRDLTGTYEGMPDEILQGLIQKYQTSLSVPTGDFLDGLWDKYEVKYLVWDKKTNPGWRLDQYQFLEKVAEVENFTIYQNEYSDSL